MFFKLFAKNTYSHTPTNYLQIYYTPTKYLAVTFFEKNVPS